MQRTPQNTMPPRGRQQQSQSAGRPQTQQGGEQGNQGGQSSTAGGQSIPASPALAMARRIRNEQGQERARQYLMAMEPFLAPAERAHIAQQLGVTLPVPSAPPFAQGQPNQAQQAPGQPQSSFNQGQPHTPFAGAPGGMPFGQAGGIPFMGKGSMSSPLQMMQVLSSLGGMGKKGGTQGGSGMGDPMMLAQMFGSMMGKK